MPETDLDPIRVLIVEDEFLVASMLESFLLEIGVEVVGPAYTLKEGVRLAQEETVQGAILDVNVRGDRIDPVIEILTERAVPLVLATGYGANILEQWPALPVLEKPYSERDVSDVVEGFRARSRERPPVCPSAES